jgi:hypothetical protein
LAVTRLGMNEDGLVSWLLTGNKSARNRRLVSR